MPQTSAAQDRHWKYWCLFLNDIGNGADPFLDKLGTQQRHYILSAFLDAVRTERFSQSTRHYGHLVSGSCSAALGNVAATFVAHGRHDPRLDATQKLAFLLRRQLQGYANQDPGETFQKCIPLDLLQQYTAQPTAVPYFAALQQLTLFAFFFAMRSCEYLKVSDKAYQRRTSPLRLRNLIFRHNNKIIPHTSSLIDTAQSISIRFEFQKRQQRNDTITQLATDHPTLCPVKSAARIVRRLLSEGATSDTFLYTYLATDGKQKVIDGKSALQSLRLFIANSDAADYGIAASEIGLHSLRASAAMAMYLNRVPVYTIMLLGRWSSDAFLRYIRPQVINFGEDVSTRMIQRSSYHQTQASDWQDPRTHHPLAASFSAGMGLHTTHTSSFSVWT